jgi:cytochrome P450
MISNVYSKSMLHASPVLERQAESILYDRLLPFLSSSAAAETSLDIHETWNATALDFITAYQFGLKNGSNFLRDVDYRKHWLYLYYVRKTYPYFTQELPRTTRFLKYFRINLVPLWVDDANRELEAWTKARCDATIEYLQTSAADEKDIANEPVVMKALLSGMEKEGRTKGNDSVLTNTLLKEPDLSIASEMIDQLAAGHETSAITLTYLAWELSRDTYLQDALRAELLTLSPNMLLSSSNTGRNIPNSKDLDTLPILHAVVMETLRLHAAIPGGQPRMTPYPSCILGSYHIPGGVRVGAQAHSVHRNPNIYPDPEKFDYTRWMDDRNGYTEEQRKERDRWFWAFGSGGRMCIGSNFAMHGRRSVLSRNLSHG